MDYANENGSINTPIDFNTSWARSNFDRTHNYVGTVIYELPWGPRKKWLNSGVLANVIGGWQLSNIYIAQSGVPLSITASSSLFNTPGNTAYADQVGEGGILGGPGPGRPPRWPPARAARCSTRRTIPPTLIRSARRQSSAASGQGSCTSTPRRTHS